MQSHRFIDISLIFTNFRLHYTQHDFDTKQKNIVIEEYWICIESH